MTSVNTTVKRTPIANRHQITQPLTTTVASWSTTSNYCAVPKIGVEDMNDGEPPKKYFVRDLTTHPVNDHQAPQSLTEPIAAWSSSSTYCPVASLNVENMAEGEPPLKYFLRDFDSGC